MNLKSGRVFGAGGRQRERERERDESGRNQELFLIQQKVPLPIVYPSIEKVS